MFTSFIGSVPVLPFKVDFGITDKDQEWIDPTTFYTRARVRLPHTAGNPSSITYIGNNKAALHYNPSLSCDLYCRHCESWAEYLDVKKGKPIPPRKETLKERAKGLTVIRGGGWSTKYPDVWKVVKGKYGKGVAEAWLVIGTYKLACGEFGSAAYEAAAMYGDEVAKTHTFICSDCKKMM